MPSTREIVLVYCLLVLVSVVYSYIVWHRIGWQPHRIDLSKCPSRVPPLQRWLFSAEYYYMQFEYPGGTLPPLDQWYGCDGGFQGDADMYGLGVRVGLYLAWTSQLTANLALPDLDQLLSKGYCITQLVLMVAIFVNTFRNRCTFSVEIAIMYHMFSAGHVLNAYKPYSHQAEPRAVRPLLRWDQFLYTAMYIVFLGHGTWFFLYGFDSHFALSPCGTTIFAVIWPVHNLIQLGGLYSSFGILFALVALAMCATELLYLFAYYQDYERLIIGSAIYQGLFSTNRYRQPGPSNHRLPTALSDVANHILQRVRIRLSWLGIGPYGQRNSLTAREARYALFSVLWTVTLMWSVTAIEINLQHNQVTIVDDLSSPGQYMPLAAGVANSVAVLYALLKKLLARRIRRRPSDVGIDVHSVVASTTVSAPDPHPDNDHATFPDSAANDQLSTVAGLRPARLRTF